MKTLISAVLLASALVTPALAAEPSDAQFSAHRLYFEARLAAKYCEKDGVKINDEYFKKLMSSIPALDRETTRDIYVATAHYHSKELHETPAKWCSEYATAVKSNFDWSDDAPVTFGQ